MTQAGTPPNRDFGVMDLPVNNLRRTSLYDSGRDAAESRFGVIDLLVDNAGYGHLGLFEALTIQNAQTRFPVATA
jgi:short-subunit dehydrogenase